MAARRSKSIAERGGLIRRILRPAQGTGWHFGLSKGPCKLGCSVLFAPAAPDEHRLVPGYDGDISHSRTQLLTGSAPDNIYVMYCPEQTVRLMREWESTIVTRHQPVFIWSGQSE